MLTLDCPNTLAAVINSNTDLVDAVPARRAQVQADWFGRYLASDAEFRSNNIDASEVKKRIDSHSSPCVGNMAP